MFFLVKQAGGIVKLPKQIDLSLLNTAADDDCFNASAIAKMFNLNKQTFLNNLRKSGTPFLQLVPKGQILIKAKDLRRLLKFDHAAARAAVEHSTAAPKDALKNLTKTTPKNVEFNNKTTAHYETARQKADKVLEKAGVKRWRKSTSKIKGYGFKDHGGGDGQN